jgi:(p)ppGpp synthase/HD superfamily hydrolase
MKQTVESLAEEKHEGQKYDKDKSYFQVHIKGVVLIGERLYGDTPIWGLLRPLLLLHDSKEDTDITDEEILKVSNPVVLDLVNRLTDKEGKNREERHLNTYYLIREKEIAVCGKICDRLFNMKYSLNNQSPKGKMYLKEAKSFKFALYTPDHKYAQKAWQEYDKLVKELKDLYYKKK